MPESTHQIKWAKVIDHTRCIGCHACTTACKSENLVPIGVNRTYVKHVDVGKFPQARREHQVTRCNQCAHAPCVTACPTTAMFKRADGIVDFDKALCIGCKACMAACPYDAIFINPEDHSAEKCNFCAHRIDVGLEPACVIVCPTEAILIGDLNDATSKVARIVARDAVAVRRPEKKTRPKLFYKGASQATLDPLAARRPEGGLFMWSEQRASFEHVVSGHPNFNHSSAAVLLSYDVSHAIPWDWRVSLYTWTKGISAGTYLVSLLLVLFGALGHDNPIWLWWAPVLSGGFLGITGALLVWDLEHPERFYLIFTKAQWKSWLVKGAFIITGYSLVLAAHFAGSLWHSTAIQRWLMIAGLPLSVLTAVYTAYLFAQAKGRDLWQNPLLTVHLLVQAMLLGAAALLPLVTWIQPGIARPHLLLLWVLSVASLFHLSLIWAEVSLAHSTAHARLAIWEMVHGRYRAVFWAGIALSVAGGLLAALAIPGVISTSLIMGGVPPVLLGIMLYEHAYVQAGQSVPLA
jgi:Fe-S-cluster-containing dehydrogenase component/formate-dependent nitrite reductase membrane component NrfD